MIPYFGFHLIAGETCIDDVDNLQQVGNGIISPDRTVIVPRLNFTCNGRITNIRVGLDRANNGANFPYVQVRRPLPGASLLFYVLVDNVQIRSSHLTQFNMSTFQEAMISLTGDNRAQFLSGDVIGFYNPPDSGYVIRDIATTGYVYYVFVGLNASIITLNTDVVSDRRQPLIQFTLGEYGDSCYLLTIMHLNMI